MGYEQRNVSLAFAQRRQVNVMRSEAKVEVFAEHSGRGKKFNRPIRRHNRWRRSIISRLMQPLLVKKSP